MAKEKEKHNDSPEINEEIESLEDTKISNNETQQDENIESEKVEEQKQPDPNEKIAELEDKLLRTVAEFDNYKKRTVRQYDDIRRLAEEKLLNNLLDVIDNFERAFEHADKESDNNSFQEGTELIYRQLKELLQKYSVTPIEAIGKQFDPNHHEAMMQINSDEFEEGIVALEINRGYMIDDKVLRHSKVAVSKGKANDTENDNENENKDD